MSPPKKGSLILNTGDMVKRWSNGALKSTPHRVINKSPDKPRYSIPFFYNANYNTTIRPLESGTTHGRAVKFEAVHYGDTISQTVRTNYKL